MFGLKYEFPFTCPLRYKQPFTCNTCSTPTSETTCNTLYLIPLLTITDQEEMDVNIKVTFTVTFIEFVGRAEVPSQSCTCLYVYPPILSLCTDTV